MAQEISPGKMLFGMNGTNVDHITYNKAQSQALRNHMPATSLSGIYKNSPEEEQTGLRQ
jgi:hypothetical protein